LYSSYSNNVMMGTENCSQILSFFMLNAYGCCEKCISMISKKVTRMKLTLFTHRPPHWFLIFSWFSSFLI